MPQRLHGIDQPLKKSVHVRPQDEEKQNYREATISNGWACNLWSVDA